MSDPVSNAEIEDVLSSIRRLVSSGEREKPGGVVGTSFESTNKLVLTPALRVDEADETPAEVPLMSDAHGTGPAGDRFEFRHVARDGDDVATRESDDEPDAASDTGSWITREDETATDPAQDETSEASSHDEPPEEPGDIEPLEASDEDLPLGDDNVGEDPDAESVGDAEICALEDRIAEVEAAVAARDDEWEPDGETDDPYSGSDVTPMAWEDYPPEPESRGSDADGDPTVFRSVAFAPDAPETGDDESQVSGEGAEAQDDPAPEVAAQPGHDAMHQQGDEEDDSEFWDNADEAVLDEDALRDMVSEIVRQELQGALGERITRNVRKLVRREIHRALTSQEFD
ncbi:MAG: hypothetical protein ACQEVT_00995 [Pseudomonadota bacterium]|uniref:hypothetical protein n=1 Tax=Roseovarius TaxID=74030 RepID=UPI0022A89C3B|nr:hypothetical protein [Roseovarius sp. EGI FJ00037]MCZ0811817.1 hypothetical protein [Roseovarius sp. EGI FJ00037]